MQAIPENIKLQAALYAYLLQVDKFYIVASFVQPDDYEKPELYICSEGNTIIRSFSLTKDFSGFESRYIQQVVQWWNNHVKTGISPRYDNYKDRDILSDLRGRGGNKTELDINPYHNPKYDPRIRF